MARAYIPGLTVAERTFVVRERRITLDPRSNLPREVLVATKQEVTGDTVVIRAQLPGMPMILNAANQLNLPASDVPSALKVKAPDKTVRTYGTGTAVKGGEVIGETGWGPFKTKLVSPTDGVIVEISTTTGNITIQEPPITIEKSAYIDGHVLEVFPLEGASIGTLAGVVQGIFGVGPETRGTIRMVASDPRAELSAQQITEEHRNCILIGGAFAGFAALARAREAEASAVVVGCVDDQTVKQLLGYDLGVAITGGEKCGITLIITEGFGRGMQMADRTFGLLKSFDGRIASANGATQIRAGVIRPEIIIPHQTTLAEVQEAARIQTESSTAMSGGGNDALGTTVRIIRLPYFGKLATIVGRPEQPVKIETEAMVRVYEVVLPDGTRIFVPRANVEICGL